MIKKDIITISRTPERDEPIRKMLRRVFTSNYRKPLSSRSARSLNDEVFHFADWIYDGLRLAKLYKNPKNYIVKQWRHGIDGFLIHAIGHLLASSELDARCHSNAWNIWDPFEVIPREAARRARRAKRTPLRRLNAG